MWRPLRVDLPEARSRLGQDVVTPRGAVAVAMALRQPDVVLAVAVVRVGERPLLLPVRCCPLTAVWQRR